MKYVSAKSKSKKRRIKIPIKKWLKNCFKASKLKDIDIVIESTGIFRYRENLEDHIKAGAKKVILTVPPKDEIDATIVLGVNDHLLSGNEKIISNAGMLK